MQNNHINYVEFQASDLTAIKQFYQTSFNWNFTEYGPEYIAFSESGLEGGFFKSNAIVTNGALIILYHEDLSQIQNKIIKAGGQISKEIFSFPGGKRFHFLDPAGNELAVWSDK